MIKVLQDNTQPISNQTIDHRQTGNFYGRALFYLFSKIIILIKKRQVAALSPYRMSLILSSHFRVCHRINTVELT
jgi:hypothetical protein